MGHAAISIVTFTSLHAGKIFSRYHETVTDTRSWLTSPSTFPFASGLATGKCHQVSAEGPPSSLVTRLGRQSEK